MRPPRRRRAWRPALGPVLHFRGVQEGRWRVAALFGTEGEEEPPDLNADGVLLPIPPRHAGGLGGMTLWRFDFAPPRGAEDRRVAYGFPEGERWWFTVPAAGARLRLAVAAGGAPAPASRQGPWARLNGAHRTRPFHLLVQAGGQVDLAGLWAAGPEVAAWAARPPRERTASPFTPGMAEEAARFVLRAHLAAWRRPEASGLQAAVPSVMAPDGRDRGEIPDAVPEPLRGAPVASGVLGEVRRCLGLLQGVEEADAAPFVRAFPTGDIGLVALDVRPGPNPFGERARQALQAALDRLAGCRLLIVACGPALVEPRLGPQGRIAALLRAADAPPPERWRTEGREPEWLRLLRMLGDHAHRSRARVAVLSGGWGVAGLGRLAGPDHEIHQLCVPWLERLPPGRAAEALARAARTSEAVRDGLDLSYEPLPEAGGSPVAATRGWLSLDADGTGDLLAEWQVEGEPASILRWIPAVSPAS